MKTFLGRNKTEQETENGNEDSGEENTGTSKLVIYLTESDKCVDKEEENSQKLASTSLSFTNPF